jgi:hypothetical protein
MDYKTLLTIFILILISSQLWNIIWDIGKGALYVVILLLALTYLDPSSGDKIKEFINKIINLDFSFVTTILSSVSKFILGAFNKLPKLDENMLKSEVESENIPTPIVKVVSNPVAKVASKPVAKVASKPVAKVASKPVAKAKAKK